MKQLIVRNVVSFLALFCMLLLVQHLHADVLILNGGKVISGEILRSDDEGALIKVDYGTFRYPKSAIKDVKKDATSSVAIEVATNRIPNWSVIVSALAKREWSHDLKQIPATVIETGVLKNVPYISFRCASGGYELNIYGDLDNPAGVEIGAVGYLVSNGAAKSNCLELIASILSRPDDRQTIQKFGLNKEVQRRDGLTFETTLPTEPDAYGGWWVSVYDEKGLERARASGKELLVISQPVPAKVSVPPAVVPVPEPAVAWTPGDYSTSIRSDISDSTSGSGRVYVRGYYRKNGTYVNGYTRSRPHR